MYGDLEISVIATDTDLEEDLRQNRVAEAPREMRVVPMERRRAVRHYAAEAPLYARVLVLGCGGRCWEPVVGDVLPLGSA